MMRKWIKPPWMWNFSTKKEFCKQRRDMRIHISSMEHKWLPPPAKTSWTVDLLLGCADSFSKAVVLLVFAGTNCFCGSLFVHHPSSSWRHGLSLLQLQGLGYIVSMDGCPWCCKATSAIPRTLLKYSNFLISVPVASKCYGLVTSTVLNMLCHCDWQSTTSWSWFVYSYDPWEIAKKYGEYHSFRLNKYDFRQKCLLKLYFSTFVRFHNWLKLQNQNHLFQLLCHTTVLSQDKYWNVSNSLCSV